MKIHISFLTMLLLVPHATFCEKKEQSSIKEEEVIHLRTQADVIQYLRAQQKAKKIVFDQEQHETLSQTINQAALDKVLGYLPYLTKLLIEAARTAICYQIASYVPDSYKLIDSEYLQINSRDLASIGLEGASHMAMWSMLNGSRDEHDNFKLHFSKETIIDGISASMKYALINSLVIPNIKKFLLTNSTGYTYYAKLPEWIKYSKDGNAVKTKNAYANFIGNYLVNPGYDLVYQKLKRQAMRE